MGNNWNSRQPARDKHALERIRKRYNRWKAAYADKSGKWSEAKVREWFESRPRTIAAREKAFVKEMKE
tara:strand:- start:619 stop:822 length:204 start_codon:yes stop_codon:yes gene_type:complete